MSPETFKDSVLAALSADDSKELARLVDAYEPMDNDSPNESENEALMSIGKYGCSGRTDRYRPVVERLLDKGLRPDLITCSYLGLIDEARGLVARDSRLVNTQNREGISPLHAAAERGDLAMVTWLCEAGADPRKLALDDELPIVRALHAGPWKSERAIDVVDFLAPLCGVDRQLWFAASRGDVERVKSILREERPNVDEFAEAGGTALFHACHNNQIEIVGLLLDAGANPNLATTSGETPLATSCLHYLSQECDEMIITMLLAAGAHATIESAVVTEDIEFVRSYVRDHPGALSSNPPLTPLYYAVHGGRGRSLEALVELGAQPDDEIWSHVLRIFAKDQRLLQRLREATGRG